MRLFAALKQLVDFSKYREMALCGPELTKKKHPSQ